MDVKLLSEKSKFKAHKIVIALSVSALVFALISCIKYFIVYNLRYDNSEKYENYKLKVFFPSFLNLLDLIIFILPFLIFTIYLLIFHKKYKATICLPITFGIVAFYPILCKLLFAKNLTVIDLLKVIVFALLTISTLIGLKKKTYIIIAAVLALLTEMLQAVRIMSIYGCHADDLYVIFHSAAIIGSILFYVAILLFGIKNRIHPIILLSKNKNKGKISPEKSLIMLNDKLDMGMITEEEYRVKRAEIISKL